MSSILISAAVTRWSYEVDPFVKTKSQSE
jgi:hypothetical protein